MIKNVVFDLGQVLYRFDPMELVSKYVSTKEDASLLASVLFDRLYWDRLDEGTIEDNEVVSLACERLPSRLHEACGAAYYHWIYNMPPIDGMAEVVTRVKKTGKKVFLLSNISRYFADHKGEFEILGEFDYCLFSAEHSLTKPNPKIYERLLEIANIKAEETLFIDDSEKNLCGACSVGISTYLFDGNVEKLAAYLDNI